VVCKLISLLLQGQAFSDYSSSCVIAKAASRRLARTSFVYSFLMPFSKTSPSCYSIVLQCIYDLPRVILFCYSSLLQSSITTKRRMRHIPRDNPISVSV